MSKYLQFPDVVFKNRESLLAALADCGYIRVEEGTALPLYGYHGDRRAETAELVVRRQHIGSASNDLGFTLTPQGFVPIISEYDRATMHKGKFLAILRTAYHEHAAQKLATSLHGTLTRKVEGGKIKILIRR